MENPNTTNLLWAPRIPQRAVSFEALSAYQSSIGIFQLSPMLTSNREFELDFEEDSDDEDEEERQFILFSTKRRFCDYIKNSQLSCQISQRNLNSRF